MKFVDWLEQRFGRFAIPNLVTYIVFGQAAFWVLGLVQPDALSFLFFDPGLIARGEWWRVVSFVLIPPEMNVFFLFFALYFLYLVGQGVERAWGSFRLNLFYLLGVAAHALVGFTFGGGITPDYLNLALFLVFGTLYPDFEVLFFFVIPLKMRWLAILDAGFMVLSVLGAGMVYRFCSLFSLADYLLFFGPELWALMRLRQQVMQNRVEFEAAKEAAVVRAPPKVCCQCGRGHEQGADIRLCTCPACSPEGKYWCTEHLGPHLAPAPRDAQAPPPAAEPAQPAPRPSRKPSSRPGRPAKKPRAPRA